LSMHESPKKKSRRTASRSAISSVCRETKFAILLSELNQWLISSQIRDKITWIGIKVPRIAIGGRSERGDRERGKLGRTLACGFDKFSRTGHNRRVSCITNQDTFIANQGQNYPKPGYFMGSVRAFRPQLSRSRSRDTAQGSLCRWNDDKLRLELGIHHSRDSPSNQPASPEQIWVVHHCLNVVHLAPDF
jgi:hypothetical protein